MGNMRSPHTVLHVLSHGTGPQDLLNRRHTPTTDCGVRDLVGTNVIRVAVTSIWRIRQHDVWLQVLQRSSQVLHLLVERFFIVRVSKGTGTLY